MLVGQFTPGPDFLLVVKTSLNQGRRAAFFTSLGITLGLTIHTSAAIAGLAFLFSKSEPLGKLLQCAGALYLTYLSFRLFASATKAPSSETENLNTLHQPLKELDAFLQGFLTNLLNPKVVIFISAMLARFVRPDSPHSEKIIYGGIIVVQGAVFWVLFAAALQAPAIRKNFLRHHKAFNLTFALLLLLVAVTAIF